VDIYELGDRLYSRLDDEDQERMVHLRREDASSAAIVLTLDAADSKTLQPNELTAAIELARAGKFRKSSAYILQLITSGDDTDVDQ